MRPPSSTGMTKVTVQVPKALLADIQTDPKVNISQIFRQALEDYKIQKAGRDLSALRGKYRIKIDVAELRQDRNPGKTKPKTKK